MLMPAILTVNLAWPAAGPLIFLLHLFKTCAWGPSVLSSSLLIISGFADECNDDDGADNDDTKVLQYPVKHN